MKNAKNVERECWKARQYRSITQIWDLALKGYGFTSALGNVLIGMIRRNNMNSVGIGTPGRSNALLFRKGEVEVRLLPYSSAVIK